MTKRTRRRPRVHKAGTLSKQKKMDGIYKNSSIYLIQKFRLNSYDRVVARKGLDRKPEPNFAKSLKKDIQHLSQASSGRKCSDVDLSLLQQHFSKYSEAVNLILQRVYSSEKRADQIGKNLDESRGQGYVVLREVGFLNWKKDNEFGKLVFERMFRNALETAARIILADYTRRQRVNALLEHLESNPKDIDRVVETKRVPTDIIKLVKASVSKRNGSGYHYALSACKQVRRLLDEVAWKILVDQKLLDDKWISGGRRYKQRVKVKEFLKKGSPKALEIRKIIHKEFSRWRKEGFPFSTPVFSKNTEDFSASTENTTGQGYWFKVDPKRENEMVLYLKTPPGVVARERDPDSPYRSNTIRFRFLNWFPIKAARARMKAEEARKRGDYRRTIELEFRAARYDDMSEQLLNTIALQHAKRSLSNMQSKKDSVPDEINDLKSKIVLLKGTRTCAPPLIQQHGTKVIILIPFQSPDGSLLESVLSSEPRITDAGVDRGLRYPVVVSVRDEMGGYHEKKIDWVKLLEKRERMRGRTRDLKSQIARRRNNWERKHFKLKAPSHILKKERDLGSVWRKVRRLDREISHQVASETVWFCEHHNVKTIYFEDLRFFQGKGGMRTHSWNLSTNLWGQIIEGVRYRRLALGHYKGGVWTVNPYMTSQKCYQCGAKGVRVKTPDSKEEKKGGEFFYCSQCGVQIHADVNAARNIIDVQSPKPCAVPGRTGLKCPTMSKFQ